MTAATRSRLECSASERIPRLPVTAARNTFSDTSTTAEPTEPSAASCFRDWRLEGSQTLSGRLYAAPQATESGGEGVG